MSMGDIAKRYLKPSPDIPINGARIELIGNREAFVDGCRGLSDYSDETIGINIGRQTLRFSGRNLSIRNYEKTKIEIEGYIISISYE